MMLGAWSRKKQKGAKKCPDGIKTSLYEYTTQTYDTCTAVHKTHLVQDQYARERVLLVYRWYTIPYIYHVHQQNNVSEYLILTPLTGAVELLPLRQGGDAVLAVHLQLLDPRPATIAKKKSTTKTSSSITRF